METFAEVTTCATQEFGTGNHVYLFRRAPVLVNALALNAHRSSAEFALCFVVVIVVMPVAAIFGVYVPRLLLRRVVVQAVFGVYVPFVVVIHFLFIVVVVVRMIVRVAHLRRGITHASQQGNGDEK